MVKFLKTKDEPAAAAPTVGDGVLVPKESEGLKLADDDPYKKLQARNAKVKDNKSAYSFSTLNTILAIKDIRRRRKIVTRRIKRLKCLIKFLFCLAFILSCPYFYFCYAMWKYGDAEVKTLALSFIDNHVEGTTNFEAGLSLWLFFISVGRVWCPKREGLYYFTQISYLFAVMHYVVLIPLNSRNLQKNLSNLKANMRAEMELGRCYKTEVSASVPSQFQTFAKIVDSNKCVLVQKLINLPHLRPYMQTECDGEGSWYHKAISIALNGSIRFDILNGTIPPIRYNVFSKSWTASQRLHKCCGIQSHTDWQTSTAKQYVGVVLDMRRFIYPSSCCNESVFQNNPRAMCTARHVYQGQCTETERVTIITYSLGLLVILVVCGIFNFTIFTLLIRYRMMIVRFRPDLLDI